MKPEVARELHKRLQEMFKSGGTEIKPTKPSPDTSPSTITVSYEFRSPMGQVYIVCFKTLKGHVAVTVDPPYGALITASDADQARMLVLAVGEYLHLEEKVFSPQNIWLRREKVRA